MKKIFIIAPHFPPSALPPSIRVRLIVKHLKELGWQAHIFTTFHKYREEKEDKWMLELVGNDFELTEVKALNPKITRKFGVGDLGIRMLPYLLPALKNTIKKENPDFILYPVPPWYMMTIAPHLKKKMGIPYGIDFIDPWFVEELPQDANFKAKISRKIAQKFESKAVKNADIIYSVSEGINNNLQRFYGITRKPMFAIPYGVEPSDFELNVQRAETSEVIFRYIGAVWEDAYPVLETLLQALSLVAKMRKDIKIEFYGTSYAGENLAKPQTTQWIQKFDMSEFMTEKPLRVPYKKAVELTMTSDIMLIFGGMLSYYAASKLMGLIASGKPFVAFLHKQSFPAMFLQKLNYKYLVTYSEKELPKTKLQELKVIIEKIIEEIDNFVKFDMDNPIIQEHTAKGMTKKFIKPIENLLKNDSKS